MCHRTSVAIVSNTSLIHISHSVQMITSHLSTGWWLPSRVERPRTRLRAPRSIATTERSSMPPQWAALCSSAFEAQWRVSEWWLLLSTRWPDAGRGSSSVNLLCSKKWNLIRNVTSSASDNAFDMCVCVLVTACLLFISHS